MLESFRQLRGMMIPARGSQLHTADTCVTCSLFVGDTKRYDMLVVPSWMVKVSSREKEVMQLAGSDETLTANASNPTRKHISGLAKNAVIRKEQILPSQ